MISFISGILLKEKPCCNFMLKYDIKNYFRHTKTLRIFFQWNRTHTNFVKNNYFWIRQLNVCVKYGITSDKYIRFIGKKLVNYIKWFKIQDNFCYNVNVTFISSPKDGLLQFIKIKFRHIPSFFLRPPPPPKKKKKLVKIP